MEKKATFALGCFWGPDDYFSRLQGVISTTAGYAGGDKASPTYEDLGDHTESVEIVFDPDVISYKELLEHFWKQHDATVEQKTQYMSAIFTHDKEQKQQAEKSKAEQTKGGILTKIVPAGKFYRAEEYHQKYYKKHKIIGMINRMRGTC